MWCIKDLDVRDITFDFQPSGQGVHHGRSLHADGTMVVNAIELAELASSSSQVIVCDSCGTIGCASGNWVVMRRLGFGVVWIPDFERMLVDDFARWRADPPEYLQRRGAALFAGSALAQLQSIVPALSVEAVPRLKSWEAARLLQWEAPGNVLGKFPEDPVLRSEIVLAVDPGEVTDRCRELHRDDAERRFAPRHAHPADTCTRAVALVRPADLRARPRNDQTRTQNRDGALFCGTQHRRRVSPAWPRGS
jgi:hypothetical protein